MPEGGKKKSKLSSVFRIPKTPTRNTAVADNRDVLPTVNVQASRGVQPPPNVEVSPDMPSPSNVQACPEAQPISSGDGLPPRVVQPPQNIEASTDMPGPSNLQPLPPRATYSKGKGMGKNSVSKTSNRGSTESKIFEAQEQASALESFLSENPVLPFFFKFRSGKFYRPNISQFLSFLIRRLMFS